MIDQIVYVVGQINHSVNKLIAEEPWKDYKGGIWEFVGVFATEEEAIDACEDSRFFVGRAKVGENVLETLIWPGAYFPKRLRTIEIETTHIDGEEEVTVWEQHPFNQLKAGNVFRYVDGYSYTALEDAYKDTAVPFERWEVKVRWEGIIGSDM